MVRRGFCCFLFVIATVTLSTSLVCAGSLPSAASIVYAGPNINETYLPLSELSNPLQLNNATLLESQWSDEQPYTIGVLFESLGDDVAGSVNLDQGSALHLYGNSNDSALNLYGISLYKLTAADVTLDNGSSIMVDTQGTQDTGDSAIGIEIGSANESAIHFAGGSKLQARSTLVVPSNDVVVEADQWVSGIQVFSVTDLSLLVEENSQLQVTNSITGAQARADSGGFFSGGSGQLEIDLTSGAKIEVVTDLKGDQSHSGSYAVGFLDNNQIVLNLDDQAEISSISSAQGLGSDAFAVGVLAQSELAGSSFTFEGSGGASIHSHASAADAVAAAINTELDQSDMTFADSSVLTAVATAVEQRDDDESAHAVAVASTLSAEAGKEISIDINSSSIVAEMTANAIQTGNGDASAIIDFGKEAVPSAIALFDYESATLNVIDSTLNVSAEAAAQSVNGGSHATIGTGNTADKGADDDFYDQYELCGIVIDPNPLDEDRQSTTAASLHNSTVAVEATALSEDYSEVDVSGILMKNLANVQVDGEPSLQLYDSTVSVSAQATSTSPDGETIVSAIGLDIQSARGDSLILDNSRVEVEATAQSVAESEVLAAGIVMNIDSAEGDIESTLQLHDSAVKVSAQSSNTDPDGSRYGSVAGIALSHSSLILDNSSVDVEYSGDNDMAVGVMASAFMNGAYRVELLNGSHVSIKDSGDSYGMSIALLTMGDMEVNIDSSSSISGNIAILGFMGTETINNQGTIAGQMMVGELNNSSTGVLRSDFSNVEIEPYSATARNGFYYEIWHVTLDSGTTFQINSTDTFGLSECGDSVSYPLLTAVDGEGDWDQQQLNLTSQDQSSLLGLSWHDDSNANQLIVTATLLSPEQAGLSTNATAAFQAAMADSKLTFATDPDEWTPNVSGAFVAGMSQTLGTSSLNIGNRLGALMGINSGDQVAANSGMWFSLRFSEAEQDQRDGASGFDADTTGLTVGLDHEFGDSVFGFAYTRGTTDADADDNSADFDMSDNLFSLYGSYDAGAWYGEAIVSAGFGSVDGNRHVGSDIYQSDYDSTSYNAKIEMGLKFIQQGWQINPLLAMQYSVKEYDSYSETGSGSLALHVDSQDYSVFTAGLGAQIQKEFQRNWGTITPEVSGMVNYDLENDRIVSTANFVGGSTAFVTKGIEPSESSWDLGAALTIASAGEQNVSLRLGYDYSGRQDFDAHSFTGKIRCEF